MAKANTSVRRSRMGMVTATSRRPVVPEPVSEPADGLQGRPPEGPVHLFAEISNVDLHHVRVPVVGEIPDVLDEIGAAERLPGVSHEVFEEGELLRRESDLPIATPDRLGGGIEGEVSDTQHRRALALAASDHGSEASEELREREGLRQVVVRTHV